MCVQLLSSHQSKSALSSSVLLGKVSITFSIDPHQMVVFHPHLISESHCVGRQAISIVSSSAVPADEVVVVALITLPAIRTHMRFVGAAAETVVVRVFCTKAQIGLVIVAAAAAQSHYYCAWC